MSPDLPAPAAAAALASGRISPNQAREALRRQWPLWLGLAALFGATAVRFSQGLWQQPEYEHGPLMLLVALWLLWRERAAIAAAAAPARAWDAGTLLAAALVVYLLGVRLKAGYVENVGLGLSLAAALGMVGGRRLVGRCAYALLFVALATPLPSTWVFAATLGLKEWVSQAAESALHFAGYPVARDGVTLRIGPYNLLLADACSGMNSLVSLSAVGLLYVCVTARRSLAHLVLILASILPVAVATNVMRVLILTLITYHLGDEAGQGFLHEFAGFVMFLVALAGVMLIDAALSRALSAGRRLPPT